MTLNEVLSVYSAFVTPVILIIGVFLVYRLLRMYLFYGKDSITPSINIENRTLPVDEIDRSGYAFIDIKEAQKNLFADAMQGFRDFAKVKGYNVDCSIDASFSGKVGIRFTIIDDGVTVSTAKVRKDVTDYLDRIKSGDDLSDLPMVADPAEHRQLVSALQSRLTYLRHQAELQAVAGDLYKSLLRDWDHFNRPPIAYAPSLQLTLQNEGGKVMRDNNTVTNSANVSQGKNALLSSTGNVQIGATHNERNFQISSLNALENALSSSDINADAKSKAIRQLENAREELEERETPRSEEIAGWLTKAQTILLNAAAGADVLGNLNIVLKAFNMT